MATHGEPQQYSHEAPAVRRPDAIRFGTQSRRILEDLKVLGGIALARTGEAAREFRMQSSRTLGTWDLRPSEMRTRLGERMRERPLTSFFVALCVGAVLGYVLHRP